MRDNVIFELAVYRVSEDDWHSDLEKRVSDRVSATLAQVARHGASPSRDDEVEARRSALLFERPCGWDYNEIVAWIQLHFVGRGHIKCYAWQVAHRQSDGRLEPINRYRRGFKPYPFQFGHPLYKLFESYFDDEDDAAILASIRGDLEEVTERRGPLGRRHLDLRAFDAIGPTLRWRVLVGLDRT